MKVIDLKEQEDGSAIVVLDMTEEEKSLLIEIGFIKLIKDHLEREQAKVGV